MNWTPFVTVVGSIAAAFCGAFLAAHFGFKRWRQQRWIERRELLAEQVLADFYEARRVIQGVRAPGSFGHEGQSRPRPKKHEETESAERRRNAYYVPIERLIANQDLFGRLGASRYRFMALFVRAGDQPFQAVHDVQNRIGIAANMLIRNIPDWDDPKPLRPDQQEFINRQEAIIWQTSENDEIATKIEQAISEIETICRPVLEAERPRQ